jgi:hypothetical protein
MPKTPVRPSRKWLATAMEAGLMSASQEAQRTCGRCHRIYKNTEHREQCQAWHQWQDAAPARRAAEKQAKAKAKAVREAIRKRHKEEGR